jgi:hypothetical protein
VFPQFLAEIQVHVAAPDVVYQYIQAALFLVYSVYQGFYLCRLQVVYLDRDAFAARLCYQLRCVLDCLWAVHLRTLCAGGAARHIHRRALAAQFHRDGSARSPGRACYQGDLALQFGHASYGAP